MSKKANKYKLGFFVVIVFILLCVLLIILGTFDMFKPTIDCLTVVDYSVQGLSVGAKVKCKGVQVGEVTKIKLYHGNTVFIYMEIYPEALNFLNYKSSQLDKYKGFIEKQIKGGLRCQLRYEGITGNLYEEIEFYNPLDLPTIKTHIPEMDSELLYIPSIEPVLVGSIMNRVDSSLAKLTGPNGIFSEIDHTLKKVNTFLDGSQITNLLNQIEAISKNINELSHSFKETLTKDKVEGLLKQFSQTLYDIKKVSSTIKREFDDSKIPQTTAAARNLMNTSVVELHNAIDNFNSTAKSMQYLIESMNNEPDAIIWGTDKKKVVPSY